VGAIAEYRLMKIKYNLNILLLFSPGDPGVDKFYFKI
jgi:hypothetical protein